MAFPKQQINIKLTHPVYKKQNSVSVICYAFVECVCSDLTLPNVPREEDVCRLMTFSFDCF